MPLHSFLLDVKTMVVNINESLEVLAHQDVAQHGVYVGLVPFASASPFEKKKKKKKASFHGMLAHHNLCIFLKKCSLCSLSASICC